MADSDKLTDLNFNVIRGIKYFLLFYSNMSQHSELNDMYKNSYIKRIRKGLEETISKTYMYTNNKRIDLLPGGVSKLRVISKHFKTSKEIEEIYKSIYTYVVNFDFMVEECTPNIMKNKTAYAYCVFRRVEIPSFINKYEYSNQYNGIQSLLNDSESDDSDDSDDSDNDDYIVTTKGDVDKLNIIIPKFKNPYKISSFDIKACFLIITCISINYFIF